MEFLALNAEYKCKFWPTSHLTVDAENIEENFNAMNISGHDEGVSLADVARACELVCRRQLGAAAPAKERLEQILGITTKGVTLSEFVEAVRKEVHSRSLSCWELIYVTFASGVAGKFSAYFSYFVLGLIITSTISFILETEPSMRFRNLSCDCDPVPLGGPCAPCEPPLAPRLTLLKPSVSPCSHPNI
jgi:hypothetical protein